MNESTRRRRRRAACRALLTAALAALAMAACALSPGPAGTVVGKPKHISCQLIGGRQQCAWKYRLTTRDDDGDHTFPVSRDDYNDCPDQAAYPACTED